METPIEAPRMRPPKPPTIALNPALQPKFIQTLPCFATRGGHGPQECAEHGTDRAADQRGTAHVPASSHGDGHLLHAVDRNAPFHHPVGAAADAVCPRLQQGAGQDTIVTGADTCC